MDMDSSPNYRIASRLVDHILDIQPLIQLQLLLPYHLRLCFSRIRRALPDSISQHLIMLLPLPVQIRH